MYSNLLQIEDRFVQQQHEIRRELQQIDQVNKALGRTGHTSMLQQWMRSAGLRLIHFGTWLVEKNSLSAPENTNGRSQAAGLA